MDEKFVIAAINEYNNGRLSEEFLKLILTDVEGRRLERIWDILPENMKQQAEFQLRLPCYEHYNRPWMRTHIDGPPPPKYKCCEYKNNI